MNILNRTIITIIIPVLASTFAFAQQTIYFSIGDNYPISDFRLENDLDGDGSYSLCAIDDQGQLVEKAEGTYEFVVNGYLEKIDFKGGMGAVRKPDSKFFFIYLKHSNKTEDIYRLYYSVSGVLIPFPLWILILIPALLILFTLLFRRMLILLILVAFVAFFVFQGLDLRSFIRLVGGGIGSLFH